MILGFDFGNHNQTPSINVGTKKNLWLNSISGEIRYWNLGGYPMEASYAALWNILVYKLLHSRRTTFQP
jgi:hypothetical protein